MFHQQFHNILHPITCDRKLNIFRPDHYQLAACHLNHFIHSVGMTLSPEDFLVNPFEALNVIPQARLHRHIITDDPFQIGILDTMAS